MSTMSEREQNAWADVIKTAPRTRQDDAPTKQPTNHYSDLDQSHTISYLRGHFSLVIWLKTV